MVGGKIIDSAVCHVCNPPRQYLWVMDGTTEMQISVRLAEIHPEIGDSVWWQGDKAYWTPADGRFADKAIERLGYSHSPKPNIFHCADRVIARPIVEPAPPQTILESNACHWLVEIGLSVAVLVGIGSLVLWAFP